MRYKLVIFDMDGTFVDSRPYHAAIFYDFFERFYHKIPYDDCYALMGKAIRTIFDEVGMPPEIQSDNYRRVTACYEEKGKDFLHLTKVPEGFRETMQYMKKERISRAIVTNSLMCVVDQFLTYHEIGDLFDLKVGADEHSFDKADRCRGVIQTLGLDLSEVLMVGDAEGDMILANKVGADACFAKTPIAWYEDGEYIDKVLKPRYTVTSYAELLDLLKSIQ